MKTLQEARNMADCCFLFNLNVYNIRSEMMIKSSRFSKRSEKALSIKIKCQIMLFVIFWNYHSRN